MCHFGARLALLLKDRRTGIQYHITMDWCWCILQTATIQHHFTMDWYRTILQIADITVGKILYYLFFFESLNIIYNDVYILQSTVSDLIVWNF